jgi:hypothetical protein
MRHCPSVNDSSEEIEYAESDVENDVGLDTDLRTSTLVQTRMTGNAKILKMKHGSPIMGIIRLSTTSNSWKHWVNKSIQKEATRTALLAY